jgi:DivIVA domain-containing protein
MHANNNKKISLIKFDQNAHEIDVSILDKKFSEKDNGYDPYEVDSFLDEIRDYLIQVKEVFDIIFINKEETKELNEKLQAENNALIEKLKIKDKEIESFQNEGYGGMKNSLELNNQKKELNELKSKMEKLLNDKKN